MHQVTVEILGLKITAHQILELLAYGVGFQLYLFFRRRWKSGPSLTWEQTRWIMIGAIFGAFFGSRLLALADAFPLIWTRSPDWRILLGAKTIVGALLGGWIGVEIAKRRLNIGHPTGDIYVFPVIAGMCIGRIGCFLGGIEDHTYGVATSLPWGVDFGDGIRRHPTQLYEIAFLLCMAGFFAWRVKTFRQRGCMFSHFMFGYLVFRFFSEFIKPTWSMPIIHLSPIQLACLAGIAYSVKHSNDPCCGRNPEDSFSAKERNTEIPGEFTELTVSLCPTCLRKVDAKVVIESGRVFLKKFCPEHGPQRVMVAHDCEYWRESRRLYTPPTAPLRRNTERRLGCPWDCGLCPDHEQHSCLALVEITERCDLQCSVCYSASGPQSPHRTMDQIEKMLDAVVASEGYANVVQISGGEPTLHPQLFAVFDAVKHRSVGHLMLNTNGKRIAEDPEFTQRLSAYMPGFEVYLQYDSGHPETLRKLRGRDLSDIRKRALAELNRHGISTTLVVTLKKGLNDNEIGEILDFAIKQPCVRGVTFQPIQAAGRLNTFSADSDRLTLTEVRDAVLRQHSLFTRKDLVPVPCHADALAIGYAIRRGRKLIPLSRLVDPRSLLNLGGNTICYEQDPQIRGHVKQLFSASASPSSAAGNLNNICCTTNIPGRNGIIDYRDVFRVIIMQFMDAWNMDLRSLKRSCVHIAHPDGRLVPFETYNIFHRNACSHNPS